MEDAPVRAQPQVDWGLPDWRDGKQYPDHNVVSILEWCWEFLRRNAEYRDFWLRKISPYWQARAAIPERVEEFLSGQLDERQGKDLFLQILDLPPEQISKHFRRLSGGSPSSDSAKPGNQVFDGGHVIGWEEARRRFGLFKPVDPRMRQTDAVFELAGATEVLDAAGDMEREDKLWIEFDLRSPIEPQLNRAKLLFRVRQRTLKLPSSDVRPRIALFANYLRVLDAKESGATDTERGSYFPDLMQTMASSELEISTNGPARFATAVIASWRPGLTKRKANLADKIRRHPSFCTCLGRTLIATRL